MTDIHSHLLTLVFFLLLCALWLYWRYRRKRRLALAMRESIFRTLDLAREQFAPFSLKLVDKGAGKSGLSALLIDMDEAGLHMDVSDYVDEAWKGLPVDAYFHVESDNGPVFYLFRSALLDVKPDYGKARIILAAPRALRVEKKRRFQRMHPRKEAVRVIGVWPLDAGRPLPASTGDIGVPLTHYRPGMADEPVQVEDISASGLALRFPRARDIPGAEGRGPTTLDVGSQVLCLVVYVLDDARDRPIAFWCTGDVVNVREGLGRHQTRILGVEFTNWAVLEQGSSEIRWSHSSPTRGVKPILKWVEQMDRRQRVPWARQRNTADSPGDAPAGGQTHADTDTD